MRYFRIVVYTETKRLVEPIYLNRLLGTQGYLLCIGMIADSEDFVGDFLQEKPRCSYARSAQLPGSRYTLPPYPKSDNIRMNTYIRMRN